jgi:IclR family pca regulon transcriptional regulator
VAAVNVSTHASRSTAEHAREDLLPPLRETAARIEADMQIAGRYGRIARE